MAPVDEHGAEDLEAGSDDDFFEADDTQSEASAEHAEVVQEASAAAAAALREAVLESSSEAGGPPVEAEEAGSARSSRRASSLSSFFSSISEERKRSKDEMLRQRWVSAWQKLADDTLDDDSPDTVNATTGGASYEFGALQWQLRRPFTDTDSSSQGSGVLVGSGRSPRSLATSTGSYELVGHVPQSAEAAEVIRGSLHYFIGDDETDDEGTVCISNAAMQSSIEQLYEFLAVPESSVRLAPIASSWPGGSAMMEMKSSAEQCFGDADDMSTLREQQQLLLLSQPRAVCSSAQRFSISSSAFGEDTDYDGYAHDAEDDLAPVKWWNLPAGDLEDACSAYSTDASDGQTLEDFISPSPVAWAETEAEAEEEAEGTLVSAVSDFLANVWYTGESPRRQPAHHDTDAAAAQADPFLLTVYNSNDGLKSEVASRITVTGDGMLDSRQEGEQRARVLSLADFLADVSF